MEFPKIVYDDFYKFLMSVGLILFLIGLFSFSYLFVGNHFDWVIFYISIITMFVGVIMMLFAGNKWCKNQKCIDDKIKADSDIAIHTARNIMLTPNKDVIYRKNFLGENDDIELEEKKYKVALVSCRITSVLPNSVIFNFAKDHKAWFLIANHGPEKYKAYVKIKYFADGIEEEINDGHYGGTESWNLNALSAIQTPGIIAPDKIINALNENKRVKVEINCKVNDENNKLIEEKLPQTYIYDPDNNNWFLEP